MEAKEKEILNELISGTKCQFVIPVFQRNYDWRIKDCTRLFNDIIELASDKEHPDRKHFMGAFVCKFNKFVDTSYNQFVLIDGQQRLTSITLILKALYDHLEGFGSEYEEYKNEIKETYLINKFAKDTNLKLKLKPNKVDSEAYDKLINENTFDVNTSIGRNYNEFKRLISNMKVPFEDFYNAIQRLEGVVVLLDESDNPQVIFESLNSTGLELTDLDLIRNYLLMNCKAEEQERLYKDYWLKIEIILGEKFMQFIRDYLSLKNGIVTINSKNSTYVAFQKYFKSTKQETEQFLGNLLSLANIYKLLIKPSFENKTLQEAMSDYVSLDITTSYPFLFGLLIDNSHKDEEAHKLRDEELIKILELLESYVIRRNVCNLAGGGLSQVMAALYNELINKYSDDFYNDTFKKVEMALIGISTKAYFPKDDEFIREFKTRDMYHNRNAMYILRKMETDKQSQEIVDMDNITIEHIMPQTLSKEWIRYLNRTDYKEFHEKYCHNISNLTLTAYNSEMSNKLYVEKKANMDFSRLTLNKYFENINEWKKEDEFDTRAESLAKKAAELWPYPKVESIDDIAKESYFLLDKEKVDFSGTSPAGIQFRNKTIDSKSWADLFVKTLNCLCEDSKEVVINLLSNQVNSINDKPLISMNEASLRKGAKFIDDWFIEINNNTEKKIAVLKSVFDGLQYEQDEVIIYIK